MLNAQIKSNESRASLNDDEIVELASRILWRRLKYQGNLNSPLSTVDFLKAKLGGSEREVFAIIFLSSSNQIIEYKELFYGTINSAAVYPREVVKDVLRTNAASVILAHNHPSGSCEISSADKAITTKLINALSLIDVAVLDHLIIGNSYASFAELNLLTN
ncbi:DNA repair protein RadC [Pseudoalteromonas sp. XI10]|uniref:JAB domain-containing protein n=1 Tax=Pseudoalteromonas sp. XI10 TaxID=1766621 RepID=UPI00073379F6|nr:DNA repair protein RadC [Pseudoalteromonas sp. XI10]KTG18924.1 DNA repair protein RadC [Pseudoalteromonas sp. XI10]